MRISKLAKFFLMSVAKQPKAALFTKLTFGQLGENLLIVRG